MDDLWAAAAAEKAEGDEGEPDPWASAAHNMGMTQSMNAIAAAAAAVTTDATVNGPRVESPIAASRIAASQIATSTALVPFEGRQRGCHLIMLLVDTLGAEVLDTMPRAPAAAQSQAQFDNHAVERIVPPPRNAFGREITSRDSPVKFPSMPQWEIEALDSKFNAWRAMPYVRVFFCLVPMTTAEDIDASSKFHALNRLLWDSTNEMSKRVTTKSSIMDALGVGSSELYSKYVQRLANTLIHSDKLWRSTLEETLVRSLPKSELLCYIDCSMYDETPMRVGLSEKANQALVSASSASAANDSILSVPHSLLQPSDKK